MLACWRWQSYIVGLSPHCVYRSRAGGEQLPAGLRWGVESGFCLRVSLELCVSLREAGTGALLCRLTKVPLIELHIVSISRISAALVSGPESTATYLAQEHAGEQIGLTKEKGTLSNQPWLLKQRWHFSILLQCVWSAWHRPDCGVNVILFYSSIACSCVDDRCLWVAAPG